MFFYIVDDDAAVRSMLTEIIEDEDLGAVTGEVQDGSELCNNIPALKKTDILLIDLLMPNLDGIETIRTIKPFFTGKTIMISQVESKELISKAYSLGTEYYITKPVNRIEVILVIKKVTERIHLERSMLHIHQSLSHALSLGNAVQEHAPPLQAKITDSGQILLSDLGVLGENGCKDLLEILDYLFWLEETETFKKGFPRVKDIFMMLAKERLGSSASGKDIAREVKASEQRVRRTIFQSLNHLSSLGLDDFSNPVFESYAPKFFDFAIVRERMAELKNEQALSTTQIRINAKKFIQILYYESKRLM